MLSGQYYLLKKRRLVLSDAHRRRLGNSLPIFFFPQLVSAMADDYAVQLGFLEAPQEEDDLVNALFPSKTGGKPVRFC
jgi:hypothetical protein